jgi:ADP-ribose pyrophosphatase YjhB (NUDIX family)
VQRLWWRLRRPQTRGARALVTDGTGRICLVRHTYKHGWYLPGGGIRRNEEPEDAVSRELREETGMQAEAVRLIGTYSNDREGKRDTIFLYEVQASGEPEPSCREIAECGWFPIEAPPSGTSPATRRRLLEFSGAEVAIPIW